MEYTDWDEADSMMISANRMLKYMNTLKRIQEFYATQTNEVTVKKFVPDLNGEVTIHINLSNVDYEWESLLLEDSQIAEVTFKSYSMILETTGDIRIIDLKENTAYGKGQIPTSVKELIKEGKIYYNNDYEVEDNNWFAVVYGRDGQYFDDDVFEAMPENLDQLINVLISIFIDYVDRSDPGAYERELSLIKC